MLDAQCLEQRTELEWNSERRRIGYFQQLVVPGVFSVGKGEFLTDEDQGQRRKRNSQSPSGQMIPEAGKFARQGQESRTCRQQQGHLDRHAALGGRRGAQGGDSARGGDEIDDELVDMELVQLIEAIVGVQDQQYRCGDDGGRRLQDGIAPARSLGACR